LKGDGITTLDIHYYLVVGMAIHNAQLSAHYSVMVDCEWCVYWGYGTAVKVHWDDW